MEKLLAPVEEQVRVYQETHDPATITGEDIWRAAADLFSAIEENPNDPGAEHALLTLGWLHFHRFTELPPGQDLQDYARAVRCLRPLNHYPDHVPAPMRRTIGPEYDHSALIAFGELLLAESTVSPDELLLDIAIALLGDAVRLAAGDPDRPNPASTLARALRQRYTRDGTPEDLTRAEALEAAGAPAHEPLDRTAHLMNHAEYYCEQFKQQRDLANLDRAVGAFEEALAAGDLGDEMVEDVLTNLMELCLARAQLTNAAEAADRALAFAREAGTYRADRGRTATTLGLVHVTRHQITGNSADLRAAIDELGQATPDDEDEPTWLSRLQIAYSRLYHATSDRTALDEAIKLARRALSVTDAGSPNHADSLINLALLYRQRFDLSGDTEDIDEVIALQERALVNTPVQGPYRAARLASLAHVLATRFEHAGNPVDIVRAVSVGEQALGAAGKDDRPEILGSYARILFDRYEHTGSTGDLDRAATLGREAVDTAAEPSPVMLSDVGTIMRARFELTGTSADLDIAVDLTERAVAVAPPRDIQLPLYLMDLGNARRTRFDRTEADADLDRAVEVFEQARAAIPAGHRARAGLLANFGNVLMTRWKHRRDLADIDRAIEVFTEVAAEPTIEPSVRMGYLNSLCHCYRVRFHYRGEPVDIRRAVATGEEALAAVTHDHPGRANLIYALAASHRVGIDEFDDLTGVLHKLVAQLREIRAASPAALAQAGSEIGALARALGETTLAVEVLDEAVALLPSVVPQNSELADSEHGLAPLEGLVTTAIAAHCTVGDAAGAVRVAELGRATAFAARLDSRTAVSDLVQGHSSADVMRADGPIVLINTDTDRSDAVIVRADAAPVWVGLPDLTRGDVLDRLSALVGAVANPVHRATAPAVVGDMLAWLWDTTVSPVLAAALPDATATADPPRLWWMPSGVMSLLPLHAAGRAEEVGALDLVRSSYTPTLRALTHTRGRASSPRRSRLVVGMAHTPGMSDLPGAEREAAMLHDLGATVLTDSDATTGAVLSALGQASWVHFACHAGTPSLAATDGGLYLSDGRLSLAAITALHLDKAELAYLSACSTALPGLLNADEALHLATAFQFAGFRHVIASLWPLHDGLAVKAAAEVYARLPDTADEASWALHDTTRELRVAAPDRPDLWASLIHYGP